MATSPDNTNSALQGELEKYYETLGVSRLKRIKELADKENHVINEKIYDVHKVTVQQYNTLEQMRAALENLKGEKDHNKGVLQMADLYKELARVYLKMPENEYYNCDWHEIKLILDACAFRTLYGRPFL